MSTIMNLSVEIERLKVIYITYFTCFHILRQTAALQKNVKSSITDVYTTHSQCLTLYSYTKQSMNLIQTHETCYGTCIPLKEGTHKSFT